MVDIIMTTAMFDSVELERHAQQSPTASLLKALLFDWSCGTMF